MSTEPRRLVKRPTFIPGNPAKGTLGRTLLPPRGVRDLDGIAGSQPADPTERTLRRFRQNRRAGGETSRRTRRRRRTAGRSR